jgi:hypothetical protein
MWPLPENSVRELARQLRHYNVFPMFLNQYYGKNHPLAEKLRPVVYELAQDLELMTDDEYATFLEALPRWVPPMMGTPARRDREQRERVALWSLAGAIAEQGVSFRDILDAHPETSKVLEVYPELAGSFDDDGLLQIDDRFSLLDGGIAYKDHILHYHQFLRRGYRSNPNFDFHWRFARYYDATKATNEFRIAIDHRRLMPRQWYEQLMELDGWFGPPFDPAKLDDPTSVGLTVVGRNPDSLFGQANAIERTEFFWSFRDGIKTFQAEEIWTEEFQGYYLNRYVHSQRDVTHGRFIHLDGAVKAYLADAYPSRRQAHVPDEPRARWKPKLWRVDGDIALEAWVELVCFFFRQNEMVVQYLNPTAFEEEFEERVRDFRKWKLKQGS